jgi:hypothetical protein
VVDPLNEYYEGVKGLIRGRCGDGAVLVLSPPLTWADKLVKEFGEDRVRHYIIGSRSGRKEIEALRGILEEIRKGGGLVSDGKLMRELRDLLGNDLVGGVKPDCIIPYYIAWDDARDYVNKMDVDKEIKNALDLITKGFEGRGRRITWFGLDYVPEELVEEVKSAKSEDVEGWIDAYLHIISKLNLDGGVSYEVKMVFKRFIGFIETSLPIIGKVMHVVPELFMQMGAVTLSFIESLAKDEVHAFRGIIDAVTRLKALRRGGDLNTLGKLIAHKLAVDMGIPYEVVHNVLVGFAGLADDALRDIEERLDIIEIKSQSVEGIFKVYDKGGFESDAEAHPGILIINDELLIQGSVISESISETYRVVTTRGFNDLRDEVLKRLNDEGVVVLVGPRGIGKTTLATYATWTLFRKRGFRFMVNVKNLEKGTVFTGFISQYLAKHWSKYGDLLVVYDPSTIETYSLADKRTEVPKGISNTLDTLLRYIAENKRVRGRVRLLMVLPTDIYQALSQDLRDRLGRYVLDLEERGFLKDPEFIAEVIREYAKGCNIDYDKAKALADEILGRFSEGYTLIATLTGTLIASKYECRVDDVKRIIEESKGDAHYFILRYINALFKVHEDPKTAEALVEVFALRRPFVSMTRPGVPILTPGIVELIGEKKGASLLQSAEGEELRSWLVRRQHDLIEGAIGKLLICIVNRSKECEKLGDALKPWKTKGVMETLSEVSEKVRDVNSAVEYFASNYGEKLTNTLKLFSNECWKRAALIIGYASAGHVSVPRPEDLRKDVIESLGDALNRCEIDDYLLVGNEIPPLIKILVFNNTRILTEALYDNVIIKTKIKIITHTYALAEAFVDKYDEAVGEVRRVLNIARSGGSIYSSEEFYGLGLASIIARAVESGKPGDADAALHIASFAIKGVILPILIRPILDALVPLRGKAPQRYIELLASASDVENLDLDTVKYILNELNEILGNYGDVVKGRAWSLMYAIRAYADLLSRYFVHFSSGEIENIVGRVVNLLNELGKFKTSLGVIAWVHALAPALMHEYVRRRMEEKLSINVVNKASEVAEELNKLRGKVQELMSDKEFMDYVESMSIKADEETVKKVILGAASLLKHELAIYRLNNDELKEAEELFNGAAEESKEIGDYENDLVARSWVLRVEAIKGSLLVDEFRRLYEEAFNKERFKLTVRYLSVASARLGNYLVSLALTGGDEEVKKIKELLEEHLLVLNADRRVSILTRLTLNALLRPKDRKDQLGSELKDKLSVEPKELIDILKPHMHSELLPALMVAFGVIKPEDEIKLCEGEVFINVCTDFVLVAKGNSAAVEQLRERVINVFHNSLKGLSFDVESLINEFRGLVNGFDGKSLVQLIAPTTSMAWLALMLHALINGDEKLAKALALMGAVYTTVKLSTRLFLEAYDACCDLKSESFRRAIASLFFLHV